MAEALGGDTTGFLRATTPRPFTFPADHGPHAGYRTEWWYFTGNLETAGGRHFGYQLTFFRSALSSEAAERESAWGANQVYMAHFALTDVAGGEFYAFDRFSRAALGLAGARRAPLRVWLEDWSAQSVGEGAFPLRLSAAAGDVAIELLIGRGEPPVLQGERGLSQKGPEPGNASYYYSLPRMPTRGTIRVAGEDLTVSGASWMDREWGTSALATDQVGWDWFALQLSDGREVMYYQLRERDGDASRFSAGTVVGPEGETHGLDRERVRLQVLEHWESPRTGVRYPARWRLQIPGQGLDLEVTPYLADQELNLAVRYWEGAVRVRGTSHGEAVRGQGYVELTGYGEETGGRAR